MLTAEDSAFKVFSNDVSDDDAEVPEPLQTSSRIEVRSKHPEAELRPYNGNGDSFGMEIRDARFSDDQLAEICSYLLCRTSEVTFPFILNITFKLANLPTKIKFY